MLEEGRYASTTEIAEAEKIDSIFVSRLLRLTLLAPDIQEAILEGRQPKGLQLEELTRGMPGAWEEQRPHPNAAAPRRPAGPGAACTTSSFYFVGSSGSFPRS
jgi:hypothetical protein